MWLDRMNRPAFDSADGRRFDAWMNTDPRHREAFAELAAIWDSPELAEACASPTPTPMAAPAAPPPSARGHRWRRPFAIGAAAACAALVPLLVVPAVPRQYASGPGEIREVVLADGSTVELGGNSAIDVQFLPWRRKVALDNGEARFDIAHDAHRPFTVTVDTTRVTVLGTAFHIDRMGPDRMVMGVSRGLVRVDSGNATLAVAANQAVQLMGGAPERVMLQPEQQVSSNWFVARDAPLADLVEKLRRYSPRPIRIETGKAASMRVTGRFDVSDVDGTLDVLKQAYDVDVSTRPSIILVR